MTIDDYFGSWLKVLPKDIITKTTDTLLKSHTCLCPDIQNIWKAFHECDYDNLRVILIGQDPYPQIKNGTPVATGLAFANAKSTPCECYSPSLDVLIDSFEPLVSTNVISYFDPTLLCWAHQGVLLLNSALTCVPNNPGSHHLFWREFTTRLLNTLSSRNTGLVFVFMGNVAQSFLNTVDKRFHYIIRTQHPSWYARTHTRFPARLWKDINNILIGQNGYGITWIENEDKEYDKSQLG